ncbi:MAG: N-acetylmuramoyl-L-alanine amidase, partial [Candidatus Wallbacteria bacterium]|nr:N-acetylmuramoyl-L-alanine amidase [Candidatus Wallbacteria bacterium]
MKLVIHLRGSFEEAALPSTPGGRPGRNQRPGRLVAGRRDSTPHLLRAEAIARRELANKSTARFLRRLPLFTWAALTLAGSSAFAGTLDGRVVLLDPGHGGSASGMVAPGQKREADMNLAVARALARMLKQDGATVVMTRVGDGDLLAQPSPLKEELRARAVLAERADADLFVSLHHNATPDAKSPRDLLRRNRSEVYFKMEDPASGELGALLLARMRPLTRSPRNQLFPSNFAVLRNNTRPAVLGEPFYLSIALFERYALNPRFPAAHARLYRRAIESFLTAERPELELTAPYPGEILTGRDLVVRGRVLGCGPGATADVWLDGRRAIAGGALAPDGELRAVVPLPAAGSHVVRVVCTDSRGRSSAAQARSVTLSAPASTLHVSAGPPPGAVPGATVLLRVEARDRFGRTVIDGTMIRERSSGVSRPTTAGGVAFALPSPLAQGVRFESGRAVSPPLQTGAKADPRWLWGAALDLTTGRPLSSLRLHGATATIYSTDDGLYAARAGTGGLLAEAPGYVTQRVSLPASSPLTLALTPVLGGALRGLSVGLDFSAAGASAGLEPALATALTAAGCRVRPRSDPDVTERVRASNAQADDLYLAVRSSKEPVSSLQHYAASPRGKALAVAVAGLLSSGAKPVESGEYVLSNTGGTAVLLNLSAADAANPSGTAIAIARGLADALRAAGKAPADPPGK